MKLLRFSRISRNRFIGTIIFSLSAYFFYLSANLSVFSFDVLGSRFFPYVICIIMGFLSIILFFSREEHKGETDNRKDVKLNYQSIIIFLILTFFYLLALEYGFGFLLSSFFYLMVFIFILDNYRFKSVIKITFFSISISYIIYYFFQVFLQLILP